MTQYRALILRISFSALLVATGIQAGPLELAGHSHRESEKVVHDAQHDVDHAWEVYHRAALGGTLASPALQADIEQHLHEARTLVTQAREAAERGDEGLVQSFVSQVKIHTEKAIEGSKEKKK